MGSASELEYLLLLAREFQLLDKESYQPLNQQTVEAKRMLASLLKKLRAES